MDGVSGLDVHTLGIIGPAAGATIALSFTLLSLSVAVSAASGAEVHTLIQAADEALHRAKNAGRDRVEVA